MTEQEEKQVTKEFKKFHNDNQKMIIGIKNEIKNVNEMIEQIKEK